MKVPAAPLAGWMAFAGPQGSFKPGRQALGITGGAYDEIWGTFRSVRLR
jgi:hypothetical protein